MAASRKSRPLKKSRASEKARPSGSSRALKSGPSKSSRPSGSLRVSSGISGLDRMVGGGFPHNSVVLVSGPPGTGKSILCLHYLLSGAARGEAGIYVTFEQSHSDLVNDARKVGLRLEPLIKSGKLRIMSVSLNSLEQAQVDVESLVETVAEEARLIKARRIVVDSLSSVINMFTLGQLGKQIDSDVVKIADIRLIPLIIDERPIVRTLVWGLLSGLKETGCTCLVTSELLEGQSGYSRDTVSEFKADGLVMLEAAAIGEEYQRNIRVAKMRGTAIDGTRHALKITGRGMQVE